MPQQGGDGDSVCKEKRRIRFGRENQAQFEHTEFEMLVLHPRELKNVSEHLLSPYYVLGPVLSTLDAHKAWIKR